MDSYIRGQSDYLTRYLDFLKSNDMISPGCSVLDIGSGSGKHDLLLSQNECNVTQIDFSEAMLEKARSLMEQNGYGTEEIHLCDFNTVALDDPVFSGAPFDLVISNMSPAVHDIVTINKMGALSNSWCLISRFSKWSQPPRTDLLGRAGVPVSSSFSERLAKDCADMIQGVSRSGFLPMIKYVDYEWEDLRTPENIADYLTGYYELSTEQRNSLLVSAESMVDENGYFHDSVTAQVLWLYWHKAIPENG